MKIVRFKLKDNLKSDFKYGVLKENQIYQINNDFSQEKIVSSKTFFNLGSCLLDIPFTPTKIIGLAENYPGIGKADKNREPIFFLKSPNSLTIKNKIKLPFDLKTWGEPELALIIGRKLKNIKRINLKKDILGYAIANDMTCQNLYGRDHHLLRSKSPDNFCPVSYYFETDFDLSNKKIFSYHNKTLLRQDYVSNMIWDIKKILTSLTQWTTLNKFDLILTGAPSRVRDRIFLKKGDKYKCIVEGIGELTTSYK